MPVLGFINEKCEFMVKDTIIYCKQIPVKNMRFSLIIAFFSYLNLSCFIRPCLVAQHSAKKKGSLRPNRLCVMVPSCILKTHTVSHELTYSPYYRLLQFMFSVYESRVFA
jgi:hypothetical protein